jgi:hypothetical protein
MLWGAQAASCTWENESTTNPLRIGSSSPDLTVSPSISSPATSIGGGIGLAAWVVGEEQRSWEEEEVMGAGDLRERVGKKN